MLDWWLVRLRGHSLVVHLMLALAIWGILQLALKALHAEDSPIADPGTEAVIVAVSLVLPPLLTFVALRKQIRLIFALLNVPARSVPGMRRIVAQELGTLHDRIARLRRAGLDFHTDSIPDWLRRTCFSGACGAYLAVDTLTPSRFMDRYGALLDVHRDYLDSGAPRSVRINVVGTAALRKDLRDHPAQYREYVDWHVHNGVLLLQCSPMVAAKIARRHDLDQAPADVGLWVDELVLMTVTRGTRTSVRLGLVQEDLYTDVDGYVRDLIASATPLSPCKP